MKNKENIQHKNIQKQFNIKDQLFAKERLSDP